MSPSEYLRRSDIALRVPGITDRYQAGVHHSHGEPLDETPTGERTQEAYPPLTPDRKFVEVAEEPQIETDTIFYYGWPNHLDNAENTEEILSLLTSPPATLQQTFQAVDYAEVRITSLRRGAFSSPAVRTALIALCQQYGVAVAFRTGVLGKTQSGLNPGGFQRDLDDLEELHAEAGSLVFTAESLLSGVSDEDRETGEFSKGSDPRKRALHFAEAVIEYQARFGYIPRCIVGDTSLAKWRDGKHYNFPGDSRDVLDVFEEHDLPIPYAFLEAMGDTEFNPEQVGIAATHLRRLSCRLGVIPTNRAPTADEFQRRLLIHGNALHALSVRMFGLTVWGPNSGGVPTLPDHFINCVAMINALS